MDWKAARKPKFSTEKTTWSAFVNGGDFVKLERITREKGFQKEQVECQEQLDVGSADNEMEFSSA